MQLFGFTITRTSEEEREKQELQAIVPMSAEDTVMEIAPGNMMGTYLNLDATARNEGELVTKYREMSHQPECDMAIEDIINDAVVMEDNMYVCQINLDKTGLSEGVKNKIRSEFDYLLTLIDFSNKGIDIFKRWYVDGRLFYQIVINKETPGEGIRQLRYIDPRKIKKVRQQKKRKSKNIGLSEYYDKREFYMYNPKGFTTNSHGIPIAADTICYVPSGVTDARHKYVLSYLHKAIKPLNQVRMLEDAVVIYRLVRAPERRIFYVDVGNLPKIKAEQYLREMQTNYKNKLVYNAETGEVRDDRRHMTMLEDFWLPRREGGKGTEITTLPSGENLGEMADVDYFHKKLLKALNVPTSRMESEAAFNVGRTTEITRDEVKFQKFIYKLRNKFAQLFNNVLEIHLALTGIISRDEWKKIKPNIYYEFANDNHFEELKDAEIWRERFSMLSELDQFVGRYFSREWVHKNILKLTEEEIMEIDKRIAEEKQIMPDFFGMEPQEEGQPQPQSEDFLYGNNDIIEEDVVLPEDEKLDRIVNSLRSWPRQD